MRFETFDRLTIFGRRWFFRIVREGNNEPMAQSEAYNSAAKRDIAIGVLKANIADAPIRER